MQQQFLISGGKTLSGEIPVYGAKNHALKLIPACFLFEGKVTLHNIPEIEDVTRMLEIVQRIGGTVNHPKQHSVEIQTATTFGGVLPEELITKLRASIVLLGPLLGRFRKVTIQHPGGDNIGKRPIDFFIHGMQALGATVQEDGTTYHFTAPEGLRGTTFLFPMISVTGTETMMMAAVLAHGTTVLKNAACEPEIVALAEFLNASGARIEGAGTHTMTIHGGELLHAGETNVLPDRLEAGSFAMLAAITRSHLTVTNCNPNHLEVPLALMQEMGVPLNIGTNTIEVLPYEHALKPLHIVTHEYPGFPTDLQAPMTTLLTQAEGQSSVRETIYEGRLYYTEGLNTMGAKITLLDPYRVTIDGATPLVGQTVTSPDIRAGVALLIAGLAATGQTTIQNIYHIDRGYERIEQRLQAIGAEITRVNNV